MSHNRYKVFSYHKPNPFIPPNLPPWIEIDRCACCGWWSYATDKVKFYEVKGEQYCVNCYDDAADAAKECNDEHAE